MDADPSSLNAVGVSHSWEVDDEVETAHEGFVERAPDIGGQNHQSWVGLHALQQVGDLQICEAIVAVLHFGALGEQRVGLVEK